MTVSARHSPAPVHGILRLVAERGHGRRVAAVGTGLAELVPDRDRATAWTLLLGGAPQSHVDLADPTYLEFEYVRRMAAAIDLIAPSGQPLRALHLGGGALTLPRYVAATRPGSRSGRSRSTGPLVEFVRRWLPWDPRAQAAGPRGDARAALAGMRTGDYDLIVADVFAGARTPAHLTSVEFVAEVARVLAPAGWFVANVADGHRWRTPRPGRHDPRGAAGGVPGRRRGGAARAPVRQLVVLAGRTPPPIAELTRRAAGDWFPGRVEADLERFAGGSVPVHDNGAVASPAPPEGLFSSRL
jgi:hypothetical protein